MAQGITIPVNLQVMQSSLSELQKTLSTLKPNTAGFNQVKAIIESIRKEIDSLAIQGSKPFISTSQFTRAEKSVNKIEESFAQAAQVMSRVKFNDLALSPQQLAEYKQLQQNIDNIKNSIKAAKEAAKGSLLSGADTKDIIQNIDPSAATKTYDQLIKEIQAKTREVEKAYKEANNKLKEAEEKVAQGKAAENLRTGDGSAVALQQALPLKDFEKFFTKNGNFKSGGSNQFAEYLKQTFSLSDSDVTELRGQTAAKVRSLLIDVDSEINKALKRTSEKGQTADRNIPSLKAAVEERATSQAAMKTLNQRVQESGNKIEETIKNQKPAMDAATEAVNHWKDAQVNAAHAPQALTAASQQAASGLATLRNALDQGTVAFQKFQAQTNTFNSLKMAVANFMGFHQVLNLVKNGIREAANHIKELDSVMNGIAIVTDMSTGDLWNQIDAYSAMAQRYGVSIKGAYEVSKIYYQQGLETADVMTLTNETLKLSKISGMDYAVATDYMTTAIRGFKMEMQDAAKVVDVYSALAANTAVSQEELAIAMSKTASSMEGVGTTFEEASAMIGTMVAVTRESATNIGSAMKSIASRYGELTKNPLGLADAEGEAYSFNKVDTALQSVGISMKTVDGQFRSFTDVIIELGEKWNELDTTQQRYIATQFAGNRQQSRFLALVSNVDTLKANMDVAENSEDTGTVQAIKSLDSIESKMEQVRVAYQQFYTSIGAEDVWKAGLDGLRNYIDTLNGLPKVFGKIPVGAIAVITDTVSLLKNVAEQALAGLASIWPNLFKPDSNEAKAATNDVVNSVVNTSSSGEASVGAAGVRLGQAYIAGLRTGVDAHSDSVEGGKATQDVVNSIIHTSEAAAAKVEQAGKGLGESYIDGLKETLDQIDKLLAIDTKYMSNPAYQKAKRNEDYYLNQTGGPEVRRKTQEQLDHSYGSPRDMYGNGHTLNSTISGRDSDLELWNAFEKARAEASPEVQALINETIYDLANGGGWGSSSYLGKIISNDPSDIRKANAMEAMRIMNLNSLPAEGWQNFERAISMYGPTNIVKHERSVDNIISDIQTGRATSIGAYGGIPLTRDQLVYGNMPQLLAGRPLTDEQRKALEAAKTSISSTIETDTQNKKAIEEQRRAEQARKEAEERAIIESIKSTPKVEARDREAFAGAVAKATEANPTKLASWDELKAATTSTYEDEVKAETNVIQQQIAALQALKQAREDVKSASTKEEKTKAEEARQAALTEVQKYGYSKSINGKQIDKEIENLSKPSTATAGPAANVVPVKLDVVENAQAATEAGQKAAEKAQAAAAEKPIEIPVKPEDGRSGQLAFDLENLGPENTITVPIEPIVDKQKMSEDIQQTAEQIKGQVTINDLFTNPNEEQKAKQIGQNFNQDHLEELQREQELQDFEESRNAAAEEYAERQRKLAEETRAREEEARAAAKARAEEEAKFREKSLKYTMQNVDALDEEAKAMKHQEEAQKAAQSKKGLGEWTKDHSSGIRNTAYALSMLSGMLDTTSQAGAKVAGTMQLISGIMKGMTVFSGGGIMALVSGFISVVNAIDLLIEDENEKIERLTKESQKLSDEAKVAKADFNSIDKSSKKLDELKEKRYESQEASEEYQEAVNDLTSKFPQLIDSFDEAGNAILNESKMTEVLTEARKKSAEAAQEAAEGELKLLKAERETKLKEAKKNLTATAGREFVIGREELTNLNLSSYFINKLKEDVSDEDIQKSFATSYSGNRLEQFKKLFNYRGAAGFMSDYKIKDNATLADIRKDIEDFDTQNNEHLEYVKQQYLDLIDSLSTDQTNDINLSEAQEKLNTALGNWETALSSGTPQEISVAGKIVKDLFDEYRDIPAFASQIKAAEDAWGDGWKQLGEVFDKDKAIEANEKLQASLKVAELTQDSAIENSTIFNSIFSKNLNSLYEKWLTAEDGKNAGKSFDEYFTTIKATLSEPIEDASAFYAGLTEDNQKLLESMFKDSKYYNADDIINMKQFAEMPDTVKDYLKNYYTDIQQNVTDRLTSSVNQKAVTPQFIEAFQELQKSNPLNTIADEQIVNQLLDVSQQLRKYGNIKSNGFEYQSYKFLQQLSQLDGETSAAIERILLNNGFTIDGITASMKEIEGLEDKEGFDKQAFIGVLKPLLDSFIQSIPGRLLALSDEFVSGWKDAETAMNSAISGMDADSAQKWITDSKKYFKNQSKELSLTDLRYEDGQFYAKADQLLEMRQGQINDYAEKFAAAKKELDDIAAEDNFSTDAKVLAEFATKVGLDLNKYFTSDEKVITGFVNGMEAGTVIQDIKNEATTKTKELGEESLKLIALYEKELLDKAIEAIDVEGFLSGEQTTKDITSFKNALQNVYINFVEEVAGEELLNSIIETLNAGGQAAVDLVKEIKGDKATSSELEAAYYAAANQQKSALEAIESGVGTVVSGPVAQLLQEVASQFSSALTMTDLGNGTYVIDAVNNMVDVYAAIYERMRGTAETTTAQLNNTFAKILTEQDQQNVDIVDALSNASGMTYEALGNILTKYSDQTLEDFIGLADKNGIERTGFGKVRITDWGTFAKGAFGVDNLDSIRGTEEYLSAYKAYNDGLIKLNKDTEKAITNELKQIENAKAGDWLNLTEFGEKYREARLNKDFSPEFVFSKLNHYLNKWGASFEDGILKIGDESNLIGIAQALEQAAADAGLEIGNGLEQVKDTVVNILKSYSDAIVKGISGGLSNTEAADLIKKADNLGISNLHFQETTEGLKLAQESAIQLYLELSQVDKLQGQIVFDKLNESLKESNEHFATTPALLNRIKTLTEAIATGSEKINGVDQKVSEARLNQYKAELEVAKEIVAVRSAAEDESFNFMSNKIPAGQNNPLNYVKNWSQALKSIQEAYKVNNTWFRDKEKGHTRTGYMGYEDFYNVINEINNMAGIMKKPITIGKTIEGDAITLDGTLTSASDAIMHGIDTLTVVDTGDMMVNIGALGINLAKGGKEMKNGIKDGIDAVADAQIEAIDGMIAVLELIVQMEALGDVAGEDMVIELPDIVVEKGSEFDSDMDGLSDKFETWRDKFLEAGSKSRELAESITINGKNMVDWLQRAASEWKADDAAILNALYQAAISTDWNLDDIGGSLQSLLNSGKFGELVEGFTIDIGDVAYTISHGVVIKAVDWKEPTAEEILKQYKAAHPEKDEQAARQDILNAIQAFLNGEGATQDVLTIEQYIRLRHSTLIKTDKNNKDYIEDSNGNKYYYGSKGWDAAMQAAILSDQQGINQKDIHIDYKGGTAAAKVTYGLKNQIQFKIELDDGGAASWNIDSDKLPPELEGFKPSNARSQQELLEQMYKYATESSTNKEQNKIEWPTMESWIYQRFGIHLQIKTEVYKEDANGKPIQVTDPTKDPALRKAINDTLSSNEKLKMDNTAGKITVTLNDGYTVQLDADEVSVNGEVNEDLVKEKLREIYGFDTAMKDVVTQGVTEGMTQAFSNLKVTEADVDVSGIEKITSSLTQAKEAANELVDALKNLSPKQPSEQQAPEVDANYLKVHAKEMRLAENLDGSGKIKLPDNTKVTSEDDIKVVTTGQVIPDTTAWPIDLGNAPLKVGTFFTVTTPIILKLKNIIPELASDALADTDVLVQGIEGKMSSLSTNWETYLTSMEGSVTAHFSTMMAQAVAAIGVIYALLMSLQRKVSITWSLNVDSNIPGLENGNYAGWGSGNPDYTGFATNYAEMFSELHQSIVDAVVQLLNEPEKEASSVPVDVDTESAKEKVQEVKDEASKEATTPVTANTDEAKSKIDELNSEIETPATKPVEFQGNPDSLQSQLDNTNLTVQVQFKGSGTPFPAKMMEQATGNVGLAKSKGTLMGELGPELVVSNGHYFVAGQNGAEMVNLADDAIVFNHLQTEQLLKHGMSSGRGRAVTSERNAVAFAQGNINGGPAMASASAALAALKELRQMWESLRAMSIQDLAKNAGGGGGGGNEKIVDPSIWIDTVERWYNLTQEIAKLEKQITHEEVLRSKLQSDFQKNGKAYYRSQKDSLDSLKQQIAAQEQLNLSHEEYYDRRVEALERSPFGKIMEFDNEGQMHFKEGQMEWLTDLVGFDSNKGANYTDEQKYNKLVEMGFADYMKYDSNGAEIIMDADHSGDITDEERQSYYQNATQAWWDKLNDYRDTTQSAWDTIQEGRDKLLELQTAENEILQEMRDNQIDMENQVLDAIVDMREREIDALQDERDKLEESVNKYVDGLSNALDKEQKMYQNQESQNDLDKQRRRLAILQRSGGSASDIASLQNDINQSERDMYFDLQQQQIDAIQEASQLELERMDTQIEIMNETLEFQKEYGLLWEEVYSVMGGSAQQIADFINGNSEFWNQSPLAREQALNDVVFGADQWVAFRKDTGLIRDALQQQVQEADFKIYNDAMIKEFGQDYDKSGKYAKIFNETYANSRDITEASTAARGAYTADKLAAEKAERDRIAAENAAKTQQAQTIQAAPAAQASGGGNNEVRELSSYWMDIGSSHQRVHKWSNGRISYSNVEPHSFQSNGVCSKCKRYEASKDKSKQKAEAKTTAGGSVLQTILAESKKPRGKASGGYVNHGIYELGERGTETVLTASQTKVLRDNILSNRPSSLISLLKTYNEGFSQNHFDAYGKEIQTLYNNTSNDSGINIENATVNMNVQQLANDYDAKRAGEQALAEIMRIARKTSANNSIRR